MGVLSQSMHDWASRSLEGGPLVALCAQCFTSNLSRPLFLTVEWHHSNLQHPEATGESPAQARPALKDHPRYCPSLETIKAPKDPAARTIEFDDWDRLLSDMWLWLCPHCMKVR